jgi:hypothetical protein
LLAGQAQAALQQVLLMQNVKFHEASYWMTLFSLVL